MLSLKRTNTFSLLILFVVTGISLIWLVNFYMHKQDISDAEDKSKIILDQYFSIHHFINKKMKPKLIPLLEEKINEGYFDPTWMSSTYAIRQIKKEFDEHSHT